MAERFYQLTHQTLNRNIFSLCRKRWPCLTDTLLLLPSAQLCPPTPCPVGVSVLPAVDWSTLIGGFARWFFGLAPPPPGAGVRSQQPVVPCAPPSPSLHTRAHAQGKNQNHQDQDHPVEIPTISVIESSLRMNIVFTPAVWFGFKCHFPFFKQTESCEHEITKTQGRKVLHHFPYNRTRKKYL